MAAIPRVTEREPIDATGCPFVYEYTIPIGEVCGRPGYGSDDRCVFHSPRAADKLDDFAAALAEQANASFEGYVFPPDTDFAANDFGRANFARAVFTGAVTFAESTFAGAAWFDEATFRGTADFSSVEFERAASFWRARWRGPALFRRASFRDEAFFTGARFDSDLRCVDTLFARTAHFQNVRLAGPAVFLRTAFLGPALFHYTDLGGAAFRSISALTSHERIARLSLETCEFRRARGLPRTEFTEVDWGRRQTVGIGPFRRSRDHVTGDEVLARIQRHPLTLREAEAGYRALRLNAERTGDRRAASAFHYGEREMERLALSPLRRAFWSLPALYRLLAGHGERPLRPILWLLAVLVAFTAIYAAIASDRPDLTGNPWRTGFDQALRSMIWLPGAWPPGGVGAWLEAFQRVLTLGLVGLWLLCLARQLRR